MTSLLPRGASSHPFIVLFAMLGFAPILENFAPLSRPQCQRLLRHSFKLMPERVDALRENAAAMRPQSRYEPPTASIHARLEQPATGPQLRDWPRRAGGQEQDEGDWGVEHFTGARFLQLGVRQGWSQQSCLEALDAV